MGISTTSQRQLGWVDAAVWVHFLFVCVHACVSLVCVCVTVAYVSCDVVVADVLSDYDLEQNHIIVY